MQFQLSLRGKSEWKIDMCFYPLYELIRVQGGKNNQKNNIM